MGARRYYVTTRQTTHVALTNLSGRNAMCGARLAAGLDWASTPPKKICGKCVDAMSFKPNAREALAK